MKSGPAVGRAGVEEPHQRRTAGPCSFVAFVNATKREGRKGRKEGKKHGTFEKRMEGFKSEA